jgi:hypothetical protein
LRILRLFAAREVLISTSWLGESFAVDARGFADGVAKESGEGGEGSEAEFEGDVSQAEIRVLQVEDGLMSAVIFEVGTEANVEVLSKVCPEVAFGHVQGPSNVRNTLQRIGIFREKFLY